MQDALRARIDYLRDLGIFDLYRREAGPEDVVYSLQAVGELAGSESSGSPSSRPEDALAVSHASVPDPVHANQAAALSGMEPSFALKENRSPTGILSFEDARSLKDTRIPEAGSFEKDPAIAARKTPLPIIRFTAGPLIAPAARAEVLDALRREIGDCTRCPLGFAGRHKVVFGDGDPNARLLFVGEGPGADEDMQGVPFVGRAGQLLNNMIAAMGLTRQQVYIANVVKCRPPKNRVPEPVEAITCSHFLLRQIDIVRPQVIVALGSTAATYLLGSKSPLSALRGRVHAAHGTQVIVTYHPAYLLRDPTQKKAAWADLQLAMRELT